MKIAITTAGSDLEATVELRFGRAVGFLIYNTENDSFEMLDNRQQLNAAQGAGIQAGQNVINSGAKVLISGHCGPKAMQVLKMGDIAVYLTKEAVSVAEVLKRYKADELEQISEADVEDHWV